jgi:hypothetical protein
MRVWIFINQQSAKTVIGREAKQWWKSAFRKTRRGSVNLEACESFGAPVGALPCRPMPDSLRAILREVSYTPEPGNASPEF